MPELSRFFNHVDGDRLYNADEYAEYFRQVLTSGILNGGTNLQVSCNGTDRISRINPGKAWLEGYFYKNTDDPLQLTHAESHGGYDRIDRVILRLDKNTENRYIKAFIKTGIPDVAPVPPELTRDELVYEISLAQVLIVHNTSVIAANKVTDERLDGELCGLVNSLIQVDTAAMQAQFAAFMVTLAGQGYIPQSEKGEPGGVAEQDAFALHLADPTKHIPLRETTHVGNAYAVSVPGLIELTDGYPLCLRFDAASSAAITVNPNNLGAKAVVDYFGNPVTNVRQGLIANLRYSEEHENFQFLGKGGGGDAVAADLLEGKKATVDAGPIVGIIVDNGVVIITPSGVDQNISGNYRAGSKVKALALTAGNNVLIQNTQTQYVTSSSYTQTHSFNVVYGVGIVRVTFTISHYHATGGWTTQVDVQIRINGAPVGTFNNGTSSSHGSSAVVDITTEINVNSGDVITFWTKTQSAYYAGRCSSPTFKTGIAFPRFIDNRLPDMDPPD